MPGMRIEVSVNGKKTVFRPKRKKGTPSGFSHGAFVDLVIEHDDGTESKIEITHSGKYTRENMAVAVPRNPNMSEDCREPSVTGLDGLLPQVGFFLMASKSEKLMVSHSVYPSGSVEMNFTTSPWEQGLGTGR